VGYAQHEVLVDDELGCVATAILREAALAVLLQTLVTAPAASTAVHHLSDAHQVSGAVPHHRGAGGSNAPNELVRR
jgi:hypothetical protein